jgi:large subunit ribosomal protein L25
MSLTIKGEVRGEFGKNNSRRYRREGRVPAVLYGPKTDNIHLILDKRDIFTILKSETGENTIVKVSFDSESRDVMIKELQTDPVNDELLHVDLIQISMDKAVRVAVPIALTGEAIGVKTEGGFVDFVTREVQIECLPKDIPEHIEVDISELHMHQSLKVLDLESPEGGELTDDPETIIVLIQAPTKEEEFEVVEEEEEEVISEEEEPEVIKKEKAEDEEKEKEEKKEE